MNETKPNYWSVGLAAALFAAAIIWMVISGVLDLNCVGGGGWFNRSGAILVIAALIYEKVAKPYLRDKLIPTLKLSYGPTKIEPEKERKWRLGHKILGWFVKVELFCVLLGTVIWAYGDLWITCDACN